MGQGGRQVPFSFVFLNQGEIPVKHVFHYTTQPSVISTPTKVCSHNLVLEHSYRPGEKDPVYRGGPRLPAVSHKQSALGSLGVEFVGVWGCLCG